MLILKDIAIFSWLNINHILTVLGLRVYFYHGMGEKSASYFVFTRNVPTARRESAEGALKVLIIKRRENPKESY
jgi:hypothetical protein